MSLSIGGKKTNQTTNQTTSSQTNPWGPAIPGLEDFLGKLGAAAPGSALSPGTTNAIGQLESTAAGGNPWTGQIKNLTDAMFAAPSQSGTVTDAYKTLQDQLTPYANGSQLDVSKNPQLQQLMQTVGDDARNRVNSQFAGAGRDLSSGHTQALTRGVTQATAPIMYDAGNQAIARQMDASKTLFGAGSSTGQEVQGLDNAALQTRAGGVGTGNAALSAQNWGPQQMIQLEQLLKTLPIEQLGSIAPYLFQIAGLGGQSKGTGTSKTNGTQFGMGATVPLLTPGG